MNPRARIPVPFGIEVLFRMKPRRRRQTALSRHHATRRHITETAWSAPSRPRARRPGARAPPRPAHRRRAGADHRPRAPRRYQDLFAARRVAKTYLCRGARAGGTPRCARGRVGSSRRAASSGPPRSTASPTPHPHHAAGHPRRPRLGESSSPLPRAHDRPHPPTARAHETPSAHRSSATTSTPTCCSRFPATSTPAAAVGGVDRVHRPRHPVDRAGSATRRTLQQWPPGRWGTGRQGNTGRDQGGNQGHP